MEKGPKFLSKDELKEKAIGLEKPEEGVVRSDWKSAVGIQEKGLKKPVYTYDRLDGTSDKAFSISDLHGMSFIHEVIPELIAKKKKGEKVKILDIGAGAAFFTDQIRKAFPEDVEVFSTGLSKKTATNFRKKNVLDGNHRLHPDDLKWRSVLQLSDFSEFDLIIDTFGELSYTREQMGLDPQDKDVVKRVEEYLNAVIRKLKSGGFASIVLANPYGVSEDHNFITFCKARGAELTTSPNSVHAIKITKNLQ